MKEQHRPRIGELGISLSRGCFLYAHTISAASGGCDYYLGGKNHFAADREAADKWIAGTPSAVTGPREGSTRCRGRGSSLLGALVLARQGQRSRHLSHAATDALARYVLRRMGDPAAVLAVDETGS
jgi:hypothetical protein